MRRSVHLEPGEATSMFKSSHALHIFQAHQLHADLRNHAEIWAARAMQSLRISLSSVVLLLTLSLFLKRLSTASGGGPLAFIETSLHVWMYL